ncbi:MAG: hypothetical protein LBO73_02010 [Holosporaceae bacterium]|jgi:hypothetical protein|nr:hypothetical protein [Holosporaceae bacterium]
MKQGGSVANETGKNLETFVENKLKDLKYTFVKKVHFKAALILKQKFFTKQLVVGETIYNTEWSPDFTVYTPDKFHCLLIECKWQEKGGSTDEKYPYVVLNIKEKSQYPAIILLDGGGYKAGAEEWLKHQVDEEKIIGVFNMGEFTKWANQNLSIAP